MRATCKDALEEVNKSNKNCPIVLEKMTFNGFTHYMPTKKSKHSRGYLSNTRYGAVQIALTHLYLMSGKTVDGEL